MKRRSGQRFCVLHVVDSLAAGGMENGIVNVARSLKSRGFEMHVACLTRRGQFADRMPEPEMVRSLGKKAGFSAAATLRLALLLHRLRPDVVHSHNLGPLIYTSLATLRGKTHTVLQGEHSMLTAEEKSPRRLRQRRTLYGACRAVHTVSTGMLDELRALGLDARRMQAILNGVDSIRFAPASKDSARQSYDIPRDAEVIGIVARFGAHKGHLLLLDTFEQLARERPRLHLLVAGGGGPEEARVHAKIAESSFHSRIHLTGFVTSPEECYRALDFLVIPSSNEGLSNAALEAMSCGIPVLGNLDCNHEEIIDHDRNGWIADLRSPDELAEAIRERLARPEHMIQCGNRARQRIEDRFSLSKMADAYETLYRSAQAGDHF